MLLRMIGQINVSSNWFRCVFVVFLCFPNVLLFAKSASYTVDDIGRGTGKMIRDLNGWLGS